MHAPTHTPFSLSDPTIPEKANLEPIRSYGHVRVQVWRVDQSDWACKIDEGPAGVSAAMWTPDGNCVLAHASAGIRTTVCVGLILV